MKVYLDNLSPPYSGSISDWCHENVSLPPAYAIPGKFSVDSSPYLIQPFDDLRDPKVMMVNIIGATQIGKSLLAELFLPFVVVNDPGPALRLHQNDDIASVFTTTRLLPIFRNCKPTKMLLRGGSRFAASKKGIDFPHMNIKVSSAKESVLHGLSIKYILMDETHLYDVGVIEKVIARTTAFAGRRKIIISSQPNQAGSELEKWYNKGLIYEWQWMCPKCKKHQPYRWSYRRDDETYAGINWKTILNEDGETTNAALSSKTAVLECFHCRHQIQDTLENRRYLNDTAKYICIKSSGDPLIHSYTVPQFVNINIRFEEMVIQYMDARKSKKLGLDEDMITFHNQILGKFYHSGIVTDESKMARGDYSVNPSEYDKNWLRIMTVDYQAIGAIKYYVIREWSKKGNESRRLTFGVCRTWDEINDIRNKWGINQGCVGIDSGFSTTEVYQTCIRYGEDFYDPVLKKKIYIGFVPMKGDGAKLSYMHDDKVARYFAPLTKQDAIWPRDSKFYGRPAKLLLWSNYSIKLLLMSLRDRKIENVKWLIDTKDVEYERQLYSEELREEVDKKTGQRKARWVKVPGIANEYLDCEAMNLTLAIRYNCFSPTKIDEAELSKIIPEEN